MRSRYRGLVVLAVIVAMGAVASTASATLPEFKPGHLPLKVTGQTGGAITIDNPAAGGAWSYRGGTPTLSGEVAGFGKTMSNISMSFVEGESYGCNNLPSYSLAFNNLNGTLGYINKAEKKVGLMLVPAKQPIASCYQQAQNKVYAGELIGTITPLNYRTNRFTLHFEQGGGKEFPLWFEGESEKYPERFAFSMCNTACTQWNRQSTGLAATITIETSQEMEISA